MSSRSKSWLLAGLIAAVPATEAAAAEISLLRFFGGCSDEYTGVTDLEQAVGECGVIQVLANKFNAENTDGITVVTQTAEHSSYYERLATQLAGNSAPDIAVMHRSQLPNYVSRQLVEPIGEDLAAAGVDMDDFLPGAAGAVTYEDQVWGLPWDIHAIVWHVNGEIMKEAGLMDAEGNYTPPRSEEELFEQAATVREATGKRFLNMGSRNDAMPARLFYNLIWQQDSDLFAEDLSETTIESPEGTEALRLIKRLYEDGVVEGAHDSGEATQSFLRGESAAYISGVWWVNSFADQSDEGDAGLRDYAVYDFPQLLGSTPASWADSHMWVVPAKQRSDEQRDAVMTFLAYLNENSAAWAKTGHLPVRQSVLESEEFTALPHRAGYAETATRVQSVPMVQNQGPILDAVRDGLAPAWQSGTEVDATLADVQSRVERLMRRVR